MSTWGRSFSASYFTGKISGITTSNGARFNTSFKLGLPSLSRWMNVRRSRLVGACEPPGKAGRLLLFFVSVGNGSAAEAPLLPVSLVGYEWWQLWSSRCQAGPLQHGQVTLIDVTLTVYMHAYARVTWSDGVLERHLHFSRRSRNTNA